MIRTQDGTVTQSAAGGGAARIDPALPLCCDFTSVLLI